MSTKAQAHLRVEPQVSSGDRAPERLDFVDALRGLAVVFMIPLHTSHGWISPDLRSGQLWNAIQFFGGLAAPLFLSLAGVSLGLRWSRAADKGTQPRHTEDLARALSLVVLGYAMRLQMWIIDGAGYARPEAYVAELLLLGGYGLAYFSLAKLASDLRRALRGLALAGVLVAVGFVVVANVAPTRVYGLMRVDVLQCIGGSLALLVCLGRARGTRFAEPALYVVLGVLIPFVTSWTRSWVPGPLPQGLAAYFGQWEPTAGRSVLALFPLLPWLAYACVGAALGLSWARAAREGRLERLIVALCALGACLALSSAEALPHVFNALARAPWLTQPVRVAYRVGLVLVLAAVALGLSRSRLPLRAAVDTLGRASLLVYWVHLEFAFGAASSSFTKRLDYPHWALGSTVLVLAMLLLAHLRANLPELRIRRTREPAAAPLEGG